MEILSKRRERQQRRLELTKRKSAAAQERMRILSMLAKSGSTGPGKKKEDTFGMKDEDWDIYKTVSKVCVIRPIKFFLKKENQSLFVFYRHFRTEVVLIVKPNKKSLTILNQPLRGTIPILSITVARQR